MEFRCIKLKKNDKCPVCGSEPVITELVDGELPVCDLKS